MADERPLNSVQFVVGYFGKGTSSENLRLQQPLCLDGQLLLC
ncbi:hypothetical protein Nizo3894_2900 [Lactiplantibacillus plantarum]|nr:hypothetical protein JM48_2264 [Lactiplantibacillus plantarum]KZU02976.1 hypothetical protein Nizo2262_2812 [Lactiplantibacillus plantarum]KZU85881.1 hypothetical protein Nizo3894_2900 [Lactiplantibacillus plantarum]